MSELKLFVSYQYMHSLHLIKIFLYNLCMTQPQDQRGAANGISMTGMSIFKAIAPAAGGIM
jgi:hypothetical protein